MPWRFIASKGLFSKSKHLLEEEEKEKDEKQEQEEKIYNFVKMKLFPVHVHLRL